MNRNILSADTFLLHLQHGLINYVENVILTNIINTVDDTSVVHDVLQMEYHADYMADSKSMYADDAT